MKKEFQEQLMQKYGNNRQVEDEIIQKDDERYQRKNNVDNPYQYLEDDIMALLDQ